jgi:hypothetical protein
MLIYGNIALLKIAGLYHGQMFPFPSYARDEEEVQYKVVLLSSVLLPVSKVAVRTFAAKASG